MTLNAFSHLGKPLAQANISRISCSFSRLLDSSRWHTQNQLPLTTTKRHIFTDEVLGLDRFEEIQKKIQSQFGRHKEKFFARMTEYIQNDDGMVLSEDVKNLIYLSSNDPKDISTLQLALSKFEKQNESLQYGTFLYGPLVMRLACQINLPDMAMALLDRRNIGFYSQLSTVTVALNLLFKNGRYEDVMKLFEFVIENYKFDVKYPTDFSTLYLAACYKINTVESFDKAFRLIRTVKLSTGFIKHRSLYFFFALAIKQNQPNIALEIIQQANFKFYDPILQSLRLLAFANIGRYHNICDILRYNLKQDKATKYKVVFAETLNLIEQKIIKSEKADVLKDFQNLVKNLDQSGLIEKERTIESALLEPINIKRSKPGQKSAADSRESIQANAVV